MVKKAKKTEFDTIEKLTNKFLALMGTSAKAKVSEDKDNEVFVIDIESDKEKGLLIGHHGETLSSLQTILGMAVKNEIGDWRRLAVNVGDWRERQEEQLTKLAKEVAERAKQTGQVQPLYNLTPAQRRVVHLVLSEDPGIETESTGEGAERYLMVKPKNK